MSILEIDIVEKCKVLVEKFAVKHACFQTYKLEFSEWRKYHPPPTIP
jgi:hypothetical protein